MWLNQLSMDGILFNPALLIVYSGVLLIGLVLAGGAIFSLLRSFTPGHQSRPKDAARPPLSRAAGYSLGLGAIAFGAAGLILELFFDPDPATGVIVALAAGMITGLVALSALSGLSSSSPTDEALLKFDATGRHATVVIPIPAGGLGEITFREGQETINLGARSAAGRSIAKGTAVIIERVSYHVAVVSPLDTGEPPAGGDRPQGQRRP